MRKTQSIADWISSKPPRGKYTFSRQEVVDAFPQMKANAISTALSREVRKGRLMIPIQGFYVIIPDEYALRGFAPQPFYLDDMMRHLGRNYYVALLSAAGYHGASHQSPMTFSVMLEPPSMRGKSTEKYVTKYFYRSSIPTEYVEKRQTRTGYINVSGPELTAIDLIAHQQRNGSITRAATVLAELAPKLDFAKVGTAFMKVAPASCFQRLGYILDEVLGEKEVADALYSTMKSANVQMLPTSLKTGITAADCEVNSRWKIQINETIEIDEL